MAEPKPEAKAIPRGKWISPYPAERSRGRVATEVAGGIGLLGLKGIGASVAIINFAEMFVTGFRQIGGDAQYPAEITEIGWMPGWIQSVAESHNGVEAFTKFAGGAALYLGAKIIPSFIEARLANRGQVPS